MSAAADNYVRYTPSVPGGRAFWMDSGRGYGSSLYDRWVLLTLETGRQGRR